jgi:hypothetical protein
MARRGLRFETEVSWFVLVSILDIVMTWLCWSNSADRRAGLVMGRHSRGWVRRDLHRALIVSAPVNHFSGQPALGVIAALNHRTVVRLTMLGRTARIHAEFAE